MLNAAGARVPRETQSFTNEAVDIVSVEGRVPLALAEDSDVRFAPSSRNVDVNLGTLPVVLCFSPDTTSGTKEV